MTYFIFNVEDSVVRSSCITVFFERDGKEYRALPNIDSLVVLLALELFNSACSAASNVQGGVHLVDTFGGFQHSPEVEATGERPEGSDRGL